MVSRFETLDKARTKVRIKVCNIMMALTLVGCLIMTIKGKREAAAGGSLMKMNLDWHKEYNEQARQPEEGKK